VAKASGYGQYCPLAMSAELLCNRWTMLLIRELLDGSTAFNEIARGVPLMSRTLLSNRLKELEAAGLVTRSGRPGGGKVTYRLSEAGQALGPVVRTMAEWGQSWIDVEPSLERLDADFLMWDIRRNVRRIAELPDRFVVQFEFKDAPDGKRQHWLIMTEQEIDLCHFDPGFEVDVFLETDLRTMTAVWMGWRDLSSATASDELSIHGNQRLTAMTPRWLGLSRLAQIKKQSAELRVRP
jgi:DNA-binding HxlR family transcriptional regulator